MIILIWLKFVISLMVKRKVTKIIDGDTFVVDKPVRGSKYIRIADINTPEKGERGYQSAKNRLSKNISGKQVDVKPVGKSYGRTVAKVKKGTKSIK